GAATWQSSIKCLAKGGKLVTCGATKGFDVSIDLRGIFIRQQLIMGSTMGDRGDMFRIMQLVQAGKLKGGVDKVFPFTEVAKAHEYLEASQQFGKVILNFGA